MSTVVEHWNQRASLGERAGTQDLIAKALEMRALLQAVQQVNPSTVLEVGCGRGELARMIVHACSGVDYLAVDNAAEMIGAAKAMGAHPRLRFAVADVTELPQGHFDCILTERMLINVRSWPEQLAAINAISDRLNPGGHYLMCENSHDGLDAINAEREALGLPRISAPWHNRYMRASELATVTSLRLVCCELFSSTYYFLSRIVNAKLAHEAGKDPKYDAPVNQLALTLPAMGPYAQNRLWVWQKP